MGLLGSSLTSSFLPKKSSIHSITTTSLFDMPSIKQTSCTSKWLL
jgi:hypothetical protein